MSAVDDQLASGMVPVLYLVEMQFSTGTQRYTNWNHSLDWAGHSWLGLGSLLTVSAISDSERLQYPPLELGLNVANPAQLSLALGQAHTYRRRPITLWRCLLDDELRALGDPELAWAGLMDQVRLTTGDGEGNSGAAVLRCEMPGRDGRGAQTLRMNNAQHQARWPGDTFFSRIEQLVGQPTPWLSVKFQRKD